MQIHIEHSLYQSVSLPSTPQAHRQQSPHPHIPENANQQTIPYKVAVPLLQAV